jgi:hypothetical protein
MSLAKVKNEYLKHAQEMGFPFFDLAFLKNYFDESKAAINHHL